MGCSANSADDAPKAKGQPKHDVKQLETLFEHFKADGVAFRSDDEFFYLDSNAFPNHPLMVGIKAWQQQVPLLKESTRAQWIERFEAAGVPCAPIHSVPEILAHPQAQALAMRQEVPLPQPYMGKNAWRVPLTPVVAAKPISAKKALYRGAIAVAVNGVPIFNALNNRGEDAYLAGELDEYGGHCGRGDDYHYHVAPLHLEAIVGAGKPIAYALDGFPIYGTTDADGKEPTDLDEFNGRFETDGTYRYYATKKYPYINGGLRGEVTVRNDGVEPQPRDTPIRPPGQPLRGAKITEFTRDNDAKSYTLKYDLRGGTHIVKYVLEKNDAVRFTFTDAAGKETTRTYRRGKER